MQLVNSPRQIIRFCASSTSDCDGGGVVNSDRPLFIHGRDGTSLSPFRNRDDDGRRLELAFCFLSQLQWKWWWREEKEKKIDKGDLEKGWGVAGGN